MKKNTILMFIILLIISSFMVFVFHKKTKKTYFNQLTSQSFGEPAKVVFDYWELATNGNYEEIKDLVTDTPSDFEIYSEPCNFIPEVSKVNNFNASNESLSSAPVIKLSDRGLSSTIKNFNQSTVSDNFPQKIKAENNKIKQIVKQQSFENEALVTIGYGNENSTWNQKSFLLRKENNSWKIFAIMGNWQLEELNRYFATDINCSN